MLVSLIEYIPLLQKSSLILNNRARIEQINISTVKVKLQRVGDKKEQF